MDGEVATGEILEAARALGVLGGKSFALPRVLATLCAPDATAGDVAAVVSHEPGLAVRVLRVANSPLYGVRGGVGTIDRAVALLGLNSVRGIAAAACFGRNLPRSKGASAIDLDELHRHCIATAIAAEALAKVQHGRWAAEAFVAGLLHDFGVLVQLRLDSIGLQQLSATLRRDAPSGNDAAVQSVERSKTTHEHCAAVTLEAWGLPASLVAAVRHHHDPANAPKPYRELAALVHLGDGLSRACGMGFACESTVTMPDETVLASLDLTAGALDAIGATLIDRVSELLDALTGD